MPGLIYPITSKIYSRCDAKLIIDRESTIGYTKKSRKTGRKAGEDEPY